MSASTQTRVSSYPTPETGGFEFDEERWKEVRRVLAKYPERRKASAVIACLDQAQRQIGGYLTREAVEYVAKILEMPPIRVHEVATFYTMFNHKPVGKFFIQVCKTTPCMLRGADEISKAALEKLGVGLHQVSDDGLFSVCEVECLGACVNAPMVQINDDFYEDLTPEKMGAIIDALREGREVPIGPQIERQHSAPEGGANTLTEVGETGSPAVAYDPAIVGEDHPAAKNWIKPSVDEAGAEGGQAGGKKDGET